MKSAPHCTPSPNIGYLGVFSIKIQLFFYLIYWRVTFKKKKPLSIIAVQSLCGYLWQQVKIRNIIMFVGLRARQQ